MQTLPELFTDILCKYTYVSGFNGPKNDQFEDLLNSSCLVCEKAVEFVNELELFRKNETLDDLSSVEIRYMLLPAFLAYFKSHKNVERLLNLKSSEFLYKNFLKLVSENGVKTPVELLKIDSDDAKSSIERMTLDRGNKIKCYKAKKSLEEDLEKLASYIDQPNTDEEVVRKYYLTLIQNWIFKAHEELNYLRMEIDLLKFREENQTSVEDERAKRLSNDEARTTSKFKPFILTRSAVQASVFGAGYPSLPAMTIEQFYEQQVSEGKLPPHKPISSFDINRSHDEVSKPSFRRIDPSDEEREHAEQKKAQDDALEDVDDEEYLAKARRFDAFKDDNRRGDGNRMNRG